jgi:hypothetical protein
MLTEQEINNFYLEQSKYFIDNSNKVIRMEDNKLNCAILTSVDFRIMAVAENPMSISSLQDQNSYKTYSFFINKTSKYPDDYQVPFNKKRSWEIRKNLNNMKWEKNTDIKTFEELYGYILINEKVCLMDTIHFQLEHNRKRVIEKLKGQEFIYLSKYLEAKEIIENNIQEDKILKYPYVSGYANVKEISLKESAKQVLLQYEIENGYLAETENLRILFTNKLRKEKDIKNLKLILNDFNSHLYNMAL